MACGCNKTKPVALPRREETWCVECEVPQLARNHFFDMKAMVARDFIEEQRYFIGKDRRHNQRLHGWGTVCGLKVKQHPNPNCRHQYVVIEPGTAIDCCGREIVVEHEENFDFRTRFLEAWQAQYPSDEAPDPEEKHTLQVCLRYVECPTEEVPVLFDDCGCDGDACQPNRILESYALDLLVDAPRPAKELPGVQLQWVPPKEIGNASWIAQDANKHRLYVLSADAAAMLYVYDTPALTQSAIGTNPVPINATALDMAVSPGGDWLFIAVAKTGDKADILAFDANNLTAAPKQVAVDLANVTNGLQLAVAPGGRLFALVMGSDQVQAWDDPAGTPAVAANSPATVAAGAASMAIGSDGLDDWLVVAGTSELSFVKTGDLSTVTNASLPTGIAASDIALIRTGNTLRVFVADQAGKTISVYEAQPGGATPLQHKGSSPALANSPVDMVASPGGRWLYVLVQDASNQGFVQVVDTHAIELNKTAEVFGPSEMIGDDPQRIALTKDGIRLFASYTGAPGAGGLAILDVDEANCADIFLQALDGCPTCPEQDPSCIVLATIVDYTFDSDVTDDRIDNLSDRHLLPSTDLIAQAVQCLMDQGGAGEKGEQGEQGEPGKPGEPGKDGLGIDDVDATFVECTQPGGAQIVEQNGQRVLELTIPKGCPGKDAEPVKLDLPRIVAINWPHNGVIDLSTEAGKSRFGQLVDQGLVIAFEESKPVFAETFVGPGQPGPMSRQRLELEQSKVIQVLIQTNMTGFNGLFTVTRLNLVGAVTGANVKASCDKISAVEPDDIFKGPVTGARFRIVSENGTPRKEWRPGHYVVIVEGDFILGVNTIKVPDPNDPDKQIEVHPALDGNHLGPGLIGAGNATAFGLLQRCPTGDGVEGGRFVSWFSIVDGLD